MSISERLQSTAGHNPDQLTLSAPALSRGSQPDDLKRSLLDSMIL